jgi:GNAT superfamily N-acetyltransferase
MNELAFRTASRSDLSLLHEMYGELDPIRGAPEISRLEDAWRELEEDRWMNVWIASRDGEPVGSFILAIVPALGARCRPVALVEDVVVRKSARGAGNGRAMMNFAMKKAREAGAYKLMLSSNLERGEAHRFYDSIGFERHGYSFLVKL